MTAESEDSIPIWMLDTSTFLHACYIDRVALLLHVRSPLCVAEFVLRWELGQRGHGETAAWTEEWMREDRIRTRQLSLEDLDRIASLNAPQRISLGEIASVVLAERERGGVLCDDRRARRWLESRVTVIRWEDVEDFLLYAAEHGYLGELDLADSQRILVKHSYRCRVDLQIEHLQRQCNRSRENK